MQMYGAKQVISNLAVAIFWLKNSAGDIFDVQLRIWMCHISYMMMYKLQTIRVLAFS